MTSKLKCFSKLATAIFTVGFAFGLVPISHAQAQAQAPAATSADSASQPSTETAKRLQELEKEVGVLQSEIETLKDSNSDAPAMKTAAYVQPVAQSEAPPASTPAAAAPDASKVTLAGLLGPTTISGFVDAYYNFNFNQPGNLGPTTPFPNGVDGNALRFFDENANQLSLNAAEAVVDKQPDATAGGTGRAGYHLAVIYGQAAEIVNGPNNGTDRSNLALKEAYFSYLAPIGKGLTLTVGKFVTPVGAEVIESNANWNYSRSILFYYAIPFFHFGVNAKYAFNNQFSVTGYLVNGWNNTQAVNTGKTYGVSLAYTPNKYWSFIDNYMAGPQDDSFFFGATGGPNSNWRQIEDASISYTPTSKWSFLVNGDYGYGDKFAGYTKPVDWWGAAGYAKYAPSDKSYLALRYEYYSDPQGFTLFGPGNFNGHVEEGTATYSYNLTSALQTRLEFREDFSNRDIFEKGSRFVGTQPVVEIGMIYSFSSQNAK
jgi:Putative beta-barrel porin-2, OmpL-like. bbp2